MKIHPKVKWLIRSEVSENVFLQMIVGGAVFGVGIGIWTVDIYKLIEKVSIFEGLMKLKGTEVFLFVIQYIVPTVLILYGSRMLLHGITQTLDDED